MFQRLQRDIQVIFDRDPAARNMAEILLCYPGLHATLGHRLNHWLWGHGFRLLARLNAHAVRFFTGIEIHPAARIGEGFFIDHGMGVVIGETTEIGDNVTLYHGVTLGGTTWTKGKRHPTLGNNVVVGAGAKILGPITIGDHARIGSNSVVVKDVPPETTVVGIPGRMMMSGLRRSEAGEATFSAYGQESNAPDPVVKAVSCMLDQIRQMEKRLEELEGSALPGELPGVHAPATCSAPPHRGNGGDPSPLASSSSEPPPLPYQDGAQA